MEQNKLLIISLCLKVYHGKNPDGTKQTLNNFTLFKGIPREESRWNKTNSRTESSHTALGYRRSRKVGYGIVVIMYLVTLSINVQYYL